MTEKWINLTFAVGTITLAMAGLAFLTVAIDIWLTWRKKRTRWGG